MIEVGRICIKIAGRDAGKKCVIVDVLDKNTVLVDGETRRKKCNVLHLEPLAQVIKLEKGASKAVVAAEFEKLGMKARTSKPRPKTTRPRKLRKSKLAAKPAAA